MERKNIKSILQCPYKDILEYLLGIVNLTEEELKVIKEVDIKGYTEESAAETLGASRAYIQNKRAKAYKKLNKVWKSNHFVYLLLKEIEGDE